MTDVVVIGSINLDLVARCARRPGPGETVLGTSYEEFAGGKGLNQAVAAARAGADVALIGAVGDDEPGRRLAAQAVHAGVDVSSLKTSSDEPTGRAMIVVDAHGENSIVVVPGANAVVSVDRLPRAAVVLAQLEIPIDTVVDAFAVARAAGAITILNPAPARPLSPALLGACDVLIPNEHEVELLGGTDALHALGVGIVIVTRGSQGVRVSLPPDPPVDVPAYPAEVVDSTGAGDAFCGNLAARLAAGATLDDAVGWAMAAGALAVATPGAVASLPHRDATAALVNGSAAR